MNTDIKVGEGLYVTYTLLEKEANKLGITFEDAKQNMVNALIKEKQR